MSFLGKFPYLPKCCICISLRSGCVFVGLFSLLFHLVLFFFRDMVVAYYMKEALNRADTSAYAILSLLLIQTIFMRLPGIVASIAVVFGAFMVKLFIIIKTFFSLLHLMHSVKVDWIILIVAFIVHHKHLCLDILLRYRSDGNWCTFGNWTTLLSKIRSFYCNNFIWLVDVW